jgi:hypothetical protein
MSDIAERMRRASLSDFGADIDKELLDEGWREIERLQALANSYSAQILSEQAENERLRAALKPMVEHFNVGGGKVPIGKMLEDARRALEGK